MFHKMMNFAFVLVFLLVATNCAKASRIVPGSQDKSYIDFENEADETGTNNELLEQGSANLAECDCGPNSDSCKLDNNGQKECDCKYSYRPKDGYCQPFCTADWNCNNGAKCVDESCQCLPGTEGDFCKTVVECDGMKGIRMCGDPDKVLCQYDPQTHKPYCMCRIYEYQYYPPERTCIECDCDTQYGSCSLVDGQKNCTCYPGAEVGFDSYGLTTKCKPCDCGENSNGCSFRDLSGNHIYWQRVCDCKEGYSQQDSECIECNCGPHGRCSFTGWYQRCECDKGYKSFLTNDRKSLTCEACDCGENGECSFENEEKICKCNPGYAVKEGKCVDRKCTGI